MSSSSSPSAPPAELDPVLRDSIIAAIRAYKEAEYKKQKEYDFLRDFTELVGVLNPKRTSNRYIFYSDSSDDEAVTLRVFPVELVKLSKSEQEQVRAD